VLIALALPQTRRRNTKCHDLRHSETQGKVCRARVADGQRRCRYPYLCQSSCMAVCSRS
jgi:hypothetical protein